MEKLKFNISNIVSLKKEKDIINELIEIKEAIENIEEIAKETNVTFEQLKKASDKIEKETFDEKKVLKTIEEYKVAKEEEDVISMLIVLTKILSQVEDTLTGTDFNIEMVYKSMKKTIPETKKEEVEEKEPVKEEKKTVKKTEIKKEEVEKKEPVKEEKKTVKKEETKASEDEEEELVF